METPGWPDARRAPHARRALHALRRDEGERYARDGFFVRDAVFDALELEELREAVEQVANEVATASQHGRAYDIDGNRYVDTPDSTVQFEHQRGSATIRVIEPFHSLHPSFEALIDDPRIVEPMRGVVGSEEVAIWTDKINLKRPREGSGFRWHQDSPYWNHACDHVDRLPNVMVVLDEARAGNGCFRVIRGSHRRGSLPGIEDGTTLGVLFTDPDHFDERDQVAIEAAAGSLVFFSPHTVHGSQPNESDEPRRAMVITYQPGGERMFKIDRVRNAGFAGLRR